MVAALGACGSVADSKVDATPDPCPGATCECTAATEATDCGAHEFCDEGGGNRICKCAALYSDQGGACVFVGGPADSGFQDATKWTPIGDGVAVITDATGMKQPGELSFDKTAVCSFSGAKQTFTMPPYDRADSLKLTVTHTINDPMFNWPYLSTMQIGIGGQWNEFTPASGAYKSTSFCLGPAAFGGPVDIRIGALVNGNCNATTTASIRIDEVKLEVATPGECPKQFGVVNGNFQLATGWAFPNVSSGAGQILANIGENGSFGAQLSLPNKCSEATALGSVAIPPASQVQHPAIDVYWNGTSGARLAVQLGGKAIGTLNANGVLKHSRVCIPKWAAGNVTSLGFLAQRASNNNCAVALPRTFILDNMTIVDEPACGTLADITDPSFERIAAPTGPAPGWGLITGFVNDTEGSRAFIFNSPSQAKTGMGVLRTSNTNQCNAVGDGGGEFAMIVPPAQGTAGPAIKFFGKADPANTNSETRATMIPSGFGATMPNAAVPETGAYVPVTMCLPPKLIGRLVDIRLSTGDPDGGGCAVTAYEEFGFFDDVEITTDASCPAN